MSERRIISIDVPSRTHVDPATPLMGAAAWAFLEELTRDVCTFAGIAVEPMRRDVLVIVRREPR